MTKKKTAFEKVQCNECGASIIYKNKREFYICGECGMQRILDDRKNVIEA